MLNFLNNKTIEPYLIQYLQKTVADFYCKQSGKILILSCPVCKKHPYSATVIPHTYIFNCLSCKTRGNILDIVKLLEEDKQQLSDNELLNYLKTLLKIDLPSEIELHQTFDFYIKQGFDLVPLVSNGKIPIEKDWTNKIHKDKEEWLSWIENGLNIGIKTGKCSNLTVIDIDTKEIPKEICHYNYLDTYTFQETERGWHLFFTYDNQLLKTRIDELKIDIESDGGQIVVFPSIINGKIRYIVNRGIHPIPNELKTLLLSKTSFPLQTLSEKLKEDIETENFDLKVINEGNRTNFLMHLGGVLRKELNTIQTSYVINLVNRHFCNPSLSQRELQNVSNSLSRYISINEKELASKVIHYLRIVEEASARDVKEVMGETKERVDSALSFLVREGYVIKRRRLYQIIKKADWKDTFPLLANELPFQLLYFQDVARIVYGDMILLGGGSKIGKTHIGINFIKSFVKQGIKPYYICLETGSRFINIALRLGLKEGDFYWDFVADPTEIELEQNAITVIDWLLVQDKAATDSIFKHFVEQLYKTNGFLIVFAQLKEDGTFFAPNMVYQFPALVARYLYDNEDDGTYGKWIIDVIREPKHRIKRGIIPCKYDFDTKELLSIQDISKEEEKILCSTVI